MNLADFGHFYHAANSEKTSTVLISTWTYYLPNDFESEAIATSIPDFSLAYSSTGDLLCYGSQEVVGMVNIVLFSFKLTCGKASHFGLLGLPSYFFGCITFLLTLIRSKITTGGLNKTNGHAGLSIRFTTWATMSILAN